MDLNGTSSQFFDNLPVIKHFEDITDLRQFRAVPDSWFVFVSDLTDSRKAIADGKYKQVNTIGASCIVAVINALQSPLLPYVFGGDGATICICPDQFERAKTAFQGTRKMARHAFDLNLRIGAIPVSDIRAHGAELLMAKQQVSEVYTQAVFTGGGIAKADSLIKQNSSYQFEDGDEFVEADFSGLECRWNKVTRENCRMISLLVKTTSKNHETAMSAYQSIIGRINEIVAQAHPITSAALRFSWNLKWLQNEFKTRTIFNRRPGKLKYLFDLYYRIVLGKFLMRFNIVVNGFNWGRYKSDLVANSDYKKFDDMLRVVLSCTADEEQQLFSYLDSQESQGVINYGAHISESALVTCMIQDYGGLHFHFVDGDNGGYAMAANHLAAKN